MNEEHAFSLSCPVPEIGKERIEIGHGAGGLLTQRLVDTLFRPAFGQSDSDFTHDGAVLDAAGARLAFTTDGHVVQPLFFPGGDIGSLAVNGTVNDLAMCGARPLALSVSFVIEEGFLLSELQQITFSMRDAAITAGVRIVAGDTKVVERGKADGLFLSASGVGVIFAPHPVSPARVRPGDAILVSGDLGRHGMAVMAAREGLGFEPPIASDCAALIGPVQQLFDAGIEVHCLRDLTRGGLASALIEIARTASVTMRIGQSSIPVSGPVRGACEVLGIDPLYVANEGRFVTFVPADAGQHALRVLRGINEDATVIGTVEGTATPGTVMLETLGGARVLDLLAGDQLPRIC